MVIISKRMLARLGRKHPDAVAALNTWYTKTKGADWRSFAEVKRTFPTVDYVGNDRYVFDVRGNRYRIVAMIFFDIRTLYIRFAGTHAEYDKTDVKNL